MSFNLFQFDNNEGVGGFEYGGYDKYSIHPTDTNWTRLSRFEVPSKPRLLWKVSMDNAYIDGAIVNGGFAIDSENNILISDCDNNIVGDNVGRLIKINSTGQINIIFKTNMRLKSPVIGTNGLVYLTTTDSKNRSKHKLYCLFPDGKLNWEFTINDQPYSKPVLDADGNIYIFTYENEKGTLSCITDKGNLKWENKFDSVNWFEPIISKNGLIYIGLNKHKSLCAYDKSGKKVFEKKIGQGLGSSPFIIKEDCSIYACLSNTLLAIDENGNTKWEYYPVEGYTVTSPAIDKGGNLYLNLNNFKLASIDSIGKERWITQITGAVNMPPVLDKFSNVIQASFMQNYPQYKSWLEVFSDKGKKIWEYAINGTIVSCVLGNDGLIYLLSNCRTYNKKGWKEKINVQWDLYALTQE